MKKKIVFGHCPYCEEEITSGQLVLEFSGELYHNREEENRFWALPILRGGNHFRTARFRVFRRTVPQRMRL
nr:MAG TPA: TRASH domain protein [Caudoviricetes sp.]